jgi:hypothetical protein
MTHFTVTVRCVFYDITVIIHTEMKEASHVR